MSSEPAHSNFIGGSNCAARMNCPASWMMEQKLPASARKETTVYADEGTALHAAMSWMLEHDVTDAQEMFGTRYKLPTGDVVIDQEHVEALQSCLDYFDALDQELGGIDFRVERRVTIPFLPGVFGTADLIGQNAHCSVIGDWKFGQGELVNAWYEDDDGETIPNEQLMFYLLGAVHSYPEMFDVNDPDWPIHMFVAQPRHRDGPNFDRIRVTLYDVWNFKARLEIAAANAKSDTPHMAKGSWCRFMPCKAICPLHTGPLLDVSALSELMTRAQLEVSANIPVNNGDVVDYVVDWGQTYGIMLDLANRIEPLVKEWRSQAQAYLEEGHTVAGWKLVDKRATRKWTKPDKSVERRLARMGLTKDERMPRELLTPPQAEKLLKKRGQALPPGYVDAISSGLTLAPSNDVRKSYEPVSDVIAALTTALAAIR